MTPKRKQRLTLALAILLGSALIVGLIMYALKQNINLFYSTSQIIHGEAPKDARIRVGGMVVKGSMQRDNQSLHVAFLLTDTAEQIKVEYTGILPDLFKEGQGVIAQGKLDARGVFQADEVLAKHDENYMPPEITESVNKAQATKAQQVRP